MLNELFFKKYGVKHAITAAYHPQSNGQDERTNGTIKRHLSKVSIYGYQALWSLFHFKLIPLSVAAIHQTRLHFK